ncbi:MAG: hypothetical protein F6K39_15025 [Okeania sp. SIO3B3]|nr:hypothetical protein [Okeania sp. SIO3B3]
MDYPIIAREGNVYTTPQNKQVKISDTIAKLSQPQTQAEALKDLGITLSNKTLMIKFIEIGNPYADPLGDRTKVSDLLTTTVEIELTLDSLPPQPLMIESSLEPFLQDSVNFFTSINFKTPSGESRIIPVTGRGTAALEGRDNDFHAGYCTGGSCASFQARTVLVLAVASAVGASNEQIDMICEKLQPINDKYHGRGDILNYALECAKNSQMPSYLEYMKELYSEDKRSPLLKSILETGKPNEAYFQKASQKMKPEELAEN